MGCSPVLVGGSLGAGSCQLRLQVGLHLLPRSQRSPEARHRRLISARAGLQGRMRTQPISLSPAVGPAVRWGPDSCAGEDTGDISHAAIICLVDNALQSPQPKDSPVLYLWARSALCDATVTAVKGASWFPVCMQPPTPSQGRSDALLGQCKFVSVAQLQ